MADAGSPHSAQRESSTALLLAWARGRGRTAFIVMGALPDRAAVTWARGLVRALSGDVPVAPRQADLLIILGRVAHKCIPGLIRIHASMMQPTRVLVVDEGDPRLSYALASATDFVPVDVVVRGLPPAPDAFERALLALEAK